MWVLADIFNGILTVIMAVVPFVVGGLIVKWAFGGKKEDKAKSEKLFETTAILKGPLGNGLPKKPL